MQQLVEQLIHHLKRIAEDPRPFQHAASDILNKKSHLLFTPDYPVAVVHSKKRLKSPISIR